jgi:hypothetical protein
MKEIGTMLTIPIKTTTDSSTPSGTAGSTPRGSAASGSKLSAKRPRDRTAQKAHFWTTPHARADLVAIRETYRELLGGRDVAASIIIRRALRGLREELDEAVYDGRGDAELARVFRHVG